MTDGDDTVIGHVPNLTDADASWTTNDTANHHIAFLAMPGIIDNSTKIANRGVHHTAFEFGTLKAQCDNCER